MINKITPIFVPCGITPSRQFPLRAGVPYPHRSGCISKKMPRERYDQSYQNPLSNQQKRA